MSKTTYLVATVQLVLTAAIMLFGLFYIAPTLVGFQLLITAVFLIATAVALFGIFMARAAPFFGLGLFLLPLAFLASLLLSGNVLVDPPRLLATLVDSPSLRNEILRDAVLLGVIPLPASLALCFHSLKRRGIPRGHLINAFLGTIGAFFTFWGASYSLRVLEAHAAVLAEAATRSLPHLTNTLHTIYAPYALAGLLWIGVGGFFLILAVRKAYVEAVKKI
jgi:hypothetical protein